MACFRRLSRSLEMICIFLILCCPTEPTSSMKNTNSVEYLIASKEITSPPIFNSKIEHHRSSSCSRHQISNYVKCLQSLRFLNHLLLAQCILLCGDIAQNPGPIDLQAPQNLKGISFCQWNIQGLTDAKFDEISTSLVTNNNSTNKLDVLILTETFCSSKLQNSFFSIPGYTLYRKDRPVKKGGGILIYINDDLCEVRR